jgi:hypothetical protein
VTQWEKAATYSGYRDIRARIRPREFPSICQDNVLVVTETG